MSDKSFGDHINRNVVKNSLLSSAVIGLSLEDLTHKAVLLPATPCQGQVTRLDQPQGSEARTLAHADHDKPSFPSGDAFTNVPISNTSSNTFPYKIDSENIANIRGSASAAVSKASVKSEDDFDVNEYIARLQGTRYVSAPLHSHIKEDQNALETEESLEEINLNDSGNDLPVPQSITADIAQNFSQLPAVLPQVASAVFSSFSNMLSMKSREQTPDDAKSSGYQEVQFERADVGVPLMGVEESIPKDFGLPPKEPPVTGVGNYRITSKKKYAQIPGLSYGGAAQSIYHNPNIPLTSGSHGPPFMTPAGLDSEVVVLHDNATVKSEMFITPDSNALNTIEASNADQVNKAEYPIGNVFNPIASDVTMPDKAADKTTGVYNIMEKTTTIFTANESQPNVKDSQTNMPIDHKDITTPRLPIIPPPPMFSNLPRTSQAVGKSVLPPSVARRISANQPLIKPQAMPTPTFSENIFVPTIPETSHPARPAGYPVPPSITPESIKPQSISEFSIPSKIPIVSQDNSIPLFTPPEKPLSSSVAAPFFTPNAETIQPNLTEASSFTPENTQHSTIGVQFFTTPHPETSQPSTSQAPFFSSSNKVSESFGTIESNIPPPTSVPLSGANAQSITLSPFGTTGSTIAVSASNVLPANIPASSDSLSSVTTPSSAAFVPMFPSTSQPPAFFNPEQEPHPITQIPPGVTPEPAKPLIEPPKASGLNFRMTKKRPQYYSGPIEGVGDISNNVKPIIAPVIPVPSVDTSAFQGFFTPEQKQTDHYPAPNVEPDTLPFDINKPHASLEPTSQQFTPFGINQPQQRYSHEYNTAFDLSRPTIETFEPAKQESKGFGIIGSLKSKLSSIDINKIQSTVTTFFDPAYNESKGEPALETAPYVQQPYGQYSHEQSNFEIMVPNVEQNQYSHFGDPQGYGYNQNNQYYQAQTAYDYAQNEGQNASNYFTDASTSSHQVFNTAQNTNTQEYSSFTKTITENIPVNVENITSRVEQDSKENPEVIFYNPTTVQELPKNVAPYSLGNLEKPYSTDSAGLFISPNVGSHGAIGDIAVKTSINAPIGMDQNHKHLVELTKAPSFFDSHPVEDKRKLTAFGMALNEGQNDPIQSKLPFSAPLPPAMSFFDSPIITASSQESKAKTVDITDEMEKLAMAEEIAIASSPFQAIDLKIGANSESKVIDTVFVKPVCQKANAIALDKNVQNYVINKEVELGTDQKGISLMESLSKKTTPVVAVSSVPLFGLSAIIAKKTQEISDTEQDLQSVCLLDATKDTKPNPENQSFSFFENISAEDKAHDEPTKQTVGLCITDVKNVLLMEPPLENLGTILQRKASSSLPETEVKSGQNFSEDRDSSWNLDAAVVTSKDNVNVLFDKKASGFFDHLIPAETPVEGIDHNKDADATENASDFNICETCREVNPSEGRESENVTNQLIENINSSIQLSNPVEVVLTRSNPTADDREFEEKQFDDINRITEDTIETILGQAATELLDDLTTSSNNSYGWNTEQLAYASIAAIDQDLVTGVEATNFSFKTDDKYNTATDPEYTFKIDPNAIGFFGDNSLFFDNVPNNASDEIKAEFKTHEDVVLPRQMSLPSAPPMEEEEDSKSDGIDVHSIEQDAKTDFPLEEEFIIEPSETDDDKIEFRERKRSSEDSVNDTFADRIEKFKSKTGSEFLTSDDNIYLKSSEFVTPPTSMASYFDTGNYAAETHYRKSLTSPTKINAFQEQTLTNTHVLHERITNEDVFNENVLSGPFVEEMQRYVSDDVFRLPPGFEEELKRQFIEATANRNKEPFIPETSTQTHTTTTSTLNITSGYESYTFAGFKSEATISSEIKQDTIPTLGQCETKYKTTETENVKPVEQAYKYETPTLANAFGATNLLIKDHTQAVGSEIELKDTSKTIEQTSTQRVQLPDPINFFSTKMDEPKKEEKATTDNVESFSRLASYFSMPPAQPDHSKSFFELSQSQNHYRHVDDKPILSQGHVDNNTANIQNLMQDLTSPHNMNFSDDIVQTVNYFSVEYAMAEHTVPKLETVDTNKNVKNIEETNLDRLTINGQITKNEDDVDSSINNCNVNEFDKNNLDNSNGKVVDENINVEEHDGISTINTCKYCCNKLIDNKNYKVRTAADSNTREEREANMSEKDSGNQRKSVSVDFQNCAVDDQAPEGVTVVNENRSTSEYSPVRHHWFYRVDVDDKSLWRGFSMTDSNTLELNYLSPDLREDTLIPTDGGRFDVNIVGRLRISVYWKEKPTNVRRCSWFYKGTTDARYVPYTEAVADKLEEEYRHGVTTGEWHRRLVLPNNELVVMHGPAVMVHFLHGGTPDSFTSPPPSTSRPRVVRRGCEESEIEDPEPSSIDHLLLLCHGVGSACDMRFRSVEEVVEDFRATSLQLLQSHYRNSYDNGIVSRVEVLPISWHAQLHVGENGVDKRLNKVTLESIPRLRAFTNHTVLDALFYTSPVYHQAIIDTVCSELNRIYNLFKKRNPGFKGGVSLGGHSLGSVILYDLLCHQKPEAPLQSKSSARKTYLPGTAQPLAQYPQLQFPPAALYALGSPIAIFECIRGVEALGLDFALPTCKHFFNIFHPYDPIAYRIEPLINPLLQDAKPFLIPHHKGRKRMHLELKDTMVRVGADLKQKLIESLRTTWNKWKATPPPDGQLEKVVEEELEKEQLCEEPKEELLNAELTTPEMLGKLNDGRRIDYVLQEAPLEMINEYLFAMSSHVGYWESEDTMLLMLREIYSSLGVQPDCTVPQQSMTVTRTTKLDEATIINEKGRMNSLLPRAATYCTAAVKPKTAIVMLNMGGPKTIDQVGDYLHRIMTDRDMIQLPVQSKLGPWIAKRRTEEVQKKYTEIGGGSPILKWTNLQGELLTKSLDEMLPESAPHKHYVAFRYVPPFTNDTFAQLEKDGVERAIIFSQYPQYSCATTGSSLNAIADFYKTRSPPSSIKFSVIERWATSKLLAKVFAERIQEKLKAFPHRLRRDVLILFTAHSLPLKAVSRGDTYPHEVAATVSLTMAELNVSNPHRLVWQSKVGPLPWLQPYTDDAIKLYAKKGQKNMILVPIAFVNEHIETLHELDIEYCQDVAKEAGVTQIERAAAPNDHPTFIAALAEVVANHLKSDSRLSRQFLIRCPHCVSPRCESSKEFFRKLCDDREIATEKDESVLV